MDIIDTKLLYGNRYIPKKHIRLAAAERLPYIYTTIVTNELPSFGPALVFDFDILFHQSAIYNYGWLAHPTDTSIYISADDSNSEKSYKVKKILKAVDKTHSITDHELLFIGRIVLKDYLIGIMCYECSNETIELLRHKLDSNGLHKVKIYK